MYHRMKHTTLLLLSLICLGSCSQQETVIDLRILHTTDVHGALFPYDYINERPTSGSAARLASLLEQARAEDTDRLFLLDGGDFLQGEPITYYTNYIDTLQPNTVASVMNYLGYDAATMGNHDIEPGHAVYDKFRQEAKFPLLAANAVRTDNGEPYFEPYTIIDRAGAKVAILGLITPAIPQWVPAHLYEGMRFDDIVPSAQTWVERIAKEHQPDLIIGLVHSGLDNDNDEYMENAGRILAEEVPELDLILLGHDHRKYAEWIKRKGGADSVLVINPANRLERVSDIRIRLTKQGNKVTQKQVSAEFIELDDSYPVSADYVRTFHDREEAVSAFLSRPVGTLESSVDASEALFGSSGYLAVVHEMQMRTMNADVSFAAPLSIGASLPSGTIYARDLFKFCPYSNFLYTMELSGREIKGYLEHSYAGWVNQMKSKEDALILFRPDAKTSDKYKTQTPTYNYSSAHGIDYTVDVSRPIGERVNILQFSNGEPFLLDKKYRVAVNSYRAGGAGGMLTLGAGIPKAELAKRIVEGSDGDQFDSLLKHFQAQGSVSGRNPRNWSFYPTAWVEEAKPRDKAFLYSK